MQNMRNSILRHVGMRCSTGTHILNEDRNVLKGLIRQMCTSKSTTPDQVMDRVIGLVTKFDKTDGAKVTKTADFQKDLSLDSLDRVELVMAFEEEFSIEIPEENADKLTCCADVAKYITAEIESKAVEKSS